MTAAEMVVTCVTCDQVLSGGRCTNEMCPGYVPLTEAEPEAAPTVADLERALEESLPPGHCALTLAHRLAAAKALEEVNKVVEILVEPRMCRPGECEDCDAILAQRERLEREVAGEA